VQQRYNLVGHVKSPLRPEESGDCQNTRFEVKKKPTTISIEFIPRRYLILFTTVHKTQLATQYSSYKMVFNNLLICFDVLLTVHLSVFISVINQLDGQNFCFTISLIHASTCFEHMYSSSYVLSQPVHETATYRCDDTRGCVMQFWPPDDEHMCSKHVEDWNKLIIKQKFCASSWLITEIKKYPVTSFYIDENHKRNIRLPTFQLLHKI